MTAVLLGASMRGSGRCSDHPTRHQLREALIVRYFPESREQVAAVAARQLPTTEARAPKHPLPPTPARNAAFRRTVLEKSMIIAARPAGAGAHRSKRNHSCKLPISSPLKVSPNDKPSNGMALCPNHHWAMDRHLIAPCPDTKRLAGVWRVNEERLDDRIEGQRDLVALANRPVIPPGEGEILSGD